jgi:hypothetical protein
VQTKREKAERLDEYVRKLGSDFKIYAEIDGGYGHIGNDSGCYFAGEP